MRYQTADVLQIAKALRDDSAGNVSATMTEMDLAVKMLESLVAERDRAQAPVGVVRALREFVQLAEDRMRLLGALSEEMGECLEKGRAALAARQAADQLSVPNSLPDALAAFEAVVRKDPLRGLAADHFLAKLESVSPANPEFRDRQVDYDWQMFLAGWMARPVDVPEKEAGAQSL